MTSPFSPFCTTSIPFTGDLGSKPLAIASSPALCVTPILDLKLALSREMEDARKILEDRKSEAEGRLLGSNWQEERIRAWISGVTYFDWAAFEFMEEGPESLTPFVPSWSGLSSGMYDNSSVSYRSVI